MRSKWQERQPVKQGAGCVPDDIEPLVSGGELAAQDLTAVSGQTSASAAQIPRCPSATNNFAALSPRSRRSRSTPVHDSFDSPG